MSVESMALVLHHLPVSGTEKVVALGIANHDGDGGAWPTIATLAKYANVSERAVQKALARLQEQGYVTVHEQDGGTRSTPEGYRPNRYTLNVRCPEGCDGTSQHRVRGELQDTPGVTSSTDRGEPQFTPGVNPSSPEPSLEPSSETSTTTSPSVPPATADTSITAEEIARTPREPAYVPITADTERVSFERFWAAYPKKERQNAAKRAWRGVVTQGVDLGVVTYEEVVRAAHGMARKVEQEDIEPKFIPLPENWLTQQRWTDEYPPARQRPWHHVED